MEKTNNLKLNVWEKSDPILVGDFNEDNKKIDAAVGQIMAHAGNCKIVTGTYVGDGKYGRDNPNSITFPEKPVFVYVGGHFSMSAIYPMTEIAAFSAGGTDYYGIYATWNGNTLSWYSKEFGGAHYQLNYEGKTYYYFALIEN